MFDKKIVINTDRLVLRPFCETDAEGMLKIQSIPEMVKYTPDEPWRSMEDAQEFIKLTQWLYDLDHHTFRHFFAVVEKASNTLIGYCGVGGIEYDRTENEVFYAIDKEYWGRGYASEASKAMLEYGFQRLNLSKIIAAVHVENIASQKVLEKIGLKRAGIINNLAEEFSFFNGEYIYILSSEEYKNNKGEKK